MLIWLSYRITPFQRCSQCKLIPFDLDVANPLRTPSHGKDIISGWQSDEASPVKSLLAKIHLAKLVPCHLGKAQVEIVNLGAVMDCEDKWVFRAHYLSRRKPLRTQNNPRYGNALDGVIRNCGGRILRSSLDSDGVRPQTANNKYS